MANIGIFGGTFDPVQTEHILIARSAIKELNLDKLLIMPDYLPPHKTQVPSSALDRINMLSIAFDGVEKIEISRFEAEKEGKSYTYQTVEHFKNEYKDDALYFIVGGDMLTDFKTWKNPQTILDNCTLCVFEREDYATDFEKEKEYFLEHFNSGFVKLNAVGKSVSSTKIRIYCALGLNCDAFCDKKILDYINKNGLYQGGLYAEYLKKVLNEKRLIHTANVVTCAMQKVKELNLNAEQVETASMLHDVAKYLNPLSFKGFNIPKNMPRPVIHAYLGAFVAENVLNIKDEAILNAIRYHTSGRANMSTLEKLIFTADMVEEGRTYDGVERLRELYRKDLEICFRECLKEEMEHLINKGGDIFIETVNAYNFYIN